MNKTLDFSIKTMVEERLRAERMRGLVAKLRDEQDDAAGDGLYVAPPSEEEFERGPGGAVTSLVFTDQPISEGTLSSAHGFGPDYDPSALHPLIARC